MAITYYSANRLLDYNFGGTAYSQPATYYFGLSTEQININGTGAVEPTGGSYARVAFTNNKTNWGDVLNASLVNDVAIQFPESSAAWGTIIQVAMWDAPTGGNIWWFDTLTPSRLVATLTTVLFSPGAVTVSMTNP